MWSRQTRQLVEAACEEDLEQRGDLTSALLPDASADVVARVVVRADGAICGLTLAPTICDVFSRRLGVPLSFSAVNSDGDMLAADATVATVRGPHAAVLTIERTLLNFLGRMSGVATLTAQYVSAAREVNAAVKILDTRKTIPGWRELDKYAVRCGGGKNHRFGLYDAILIKDNHLVGVPTDDLATYLADRLSGLSLASKTEDGGPEDAGLPPFVEVEVDNLAQLEQVCQVSTVDVVLLDNFPPDRIREAVAQRDAAGLRGKLQLEASGGISLDNVTEIAATGVDRISVGALTHSAPGLDVALDF